MKTNRNVLKAIAAALLTVSGVASAADTQSLAVSATVPAVCKFSTPARTLTFDIAANPFAATVTGVLSGAIEYKCTKDTAAAATPVTASNGANFLGSSRRMTDGTNFMPYALTVAGSGTAGEGFGSSVTAKTVTVTSSIASADFANLPAGTYTDSVTLTLSP